MEIKNLLEIIQVQRHDFLNHLQVISGLLQLNKGDRVRDYINQVCQQYENYSKITRIKSPEILAVLLVGSNEANKSQIDIQYDIQTNLATLNVPGEVVASALNRCIKQALKFLAPPEVNDRKMKLTISEGEKKITIKLGFSGVPAEVVKDAQEQMALAEALAAYKSSSKLAVTEKEVEIYMIFPKKLA
ncbi:Spo0B domain-containing protein [Desulfotomaculum sp. 1211_IL3151]|uniref:Spo0B domain-containing protein n=1 Tax=Desulfotomaculum sp. 1211_IL3151 TaxID=3084055 RepID=UPI002FDABBB9